MYKMLKTVRCERMRNSVMGGVLLEEVLKGWLASGCKIEEMTLACGQEEWGVLDLRQISPFTAAGEKGCVQIKPHKTSHALEQCKVTCGEMMTMIDALMLVKKSKTEREKKVSQKDSSHSAF